MMKHLLYMIVGAAACFALAFAYLVILFIYDKYDWQLEALVRSGLFLLGAYFIGKTVVDVCSHFSEMRDLRRGKIHDHD